MSQNNLQKDMIIFFLDDNYIEVQDQIALCYGGYFCNSNSLIALKNVINKTKKKLGLEEWMPVKWNFSRQLENFYKKYGRVNNFNDKWKTIKQRSKAIRKTILQEVVQQEGIIRILFSTFSSPKRYNNDILRNWMLENLFQRIGLNMRSSSLNIIMCDFEHEKSQTKKILEDVYFNAYYSAEGYYSGPLRERGAFPALSYSSTYHNPYLQIADIIVGSMGQLVKDWLCNQTPKDFVGEVFQILKNSFVQNQTTREIFRYGIVSRPANFKRFLIKWELL